MFKGMLTALITPFQKDGSIDFSCFRKLVQRQVKAKVDGIVVAGSTGEGSTLLEEEFEKLVDIATSEAKGQIAVIVNTGTNATGQSIRRTEYAKTKGADGALVISPYYNKPPLRGLFRHIEAIGEVGLPIIFYYNPSRTGMKLDPETIVKLTKLPNVVSVKECSGDINFTRELLDLSPQVTVLSGDDSLVLELIEHGGKGSFSVIGNFIPEYWKEMVHVALSGEYEVAEDLLENVRTLLWAVELEPNPQGIKCLMSIANLCENNLRLPMVPATKDSFAEIKEAYKELEFEVEQLQ